MSKMPKLMWLMYVSDVHLPIMIAAINAGAIKDEQLVIAIGHNRTITIEYDIWYERFGFKDRGIIGLDQTVSIIIGNYWIRPIITNYN